MAGVFNRSQIPIGKSSALKSSQIQAQRLIDNGPSPTHLSSAARFGWLYIVQRMTQWRE
jgi:hypothetical protein